MEWGKLFANLPDDPRVQAAEAGQPGAGAIAHALDEQPSRAERGGFIPGTQVERFGGAKLRQRVAALVREQLWLPVDGGYLLNPDVWTEERNLGDSAEKKRKKDRERLAEKRAEEKRAREAEGVNAKVSRDMSHDSRATDPATCSGDSRPLYEIREDKTFTAGLVDQLPVADARAKADDDDLIISAVIARAEAETGSPVTADQARSAIRVFRQRAEASGVSIASPVRYFPDCVSKERDIWALLLADTVAAIEDHDAPGSGHAYDPDPETRLCRACSAPEVDKNHSRRRTA